jgi:hypothetical protein
MEGGRAGCNLESAKNRKRRVFASVVFWAGDGSKARGATAEALIRTDLHLIYT